ncbi:DUF4998 domain-containing protein [Bacteroides sp. 51]|uniref:DUF4998 domain-containing protein n=1 Tax=Bacteroides sp. 51 TaxID=2302938 RepID=UPI0013D45C83|nr:DUF4998 domain-containing protein [Bacteroides sp. 51]
MKQFIQSVLPVMVFVYLFGAASCSDMDDYLKYTEGKPRLYTGKVDPAIFLSGDERVVFYGMLTSDPKITKVNIYWNNRKDSLVIDVQRTSGVDIIEKPIALPEGRYYFEVISYDGEGNSSIPVVTTGVSYGDTYRQTLYNRPIKSAEKVGDNVVIEWYNGDETSPFVKVDYTDSNDRAHTIKVPTSEKKTILENFKSMSEFSMQAYYLPDELSIDTFKVAPLYIGVNEDITRLIKNPGNPFARSDDGTGKWGVIKDWQYTPNIINQNGDTAGGWSTDSGGVIHFESKDWGGDGVTNGKIYQTISLPAGHYSIEFYSDGGGSDNFTGNFMVATGNTLPDIGNTGEAIASHVWNKDFMGGTHSMEFELDQPKTVTIGWAVSFGSSTWMHINSVKLMILAE